MKALRLIILFLVLMPGISQVEVTSLPVVTNIRIKRLSGSSQDTSRVNSLTRAGIKYLSKPPGIKEAKPCIDTAHYICQKERIEIPALLHLLIAEYNLATGDYLNASEEATLAMEQAKESGDG
jgi:hypothetical protein